MPKTYNIEPVKTALQTAKQILVLLPQNPSADNVAAGLALHLALTKKGAASAIGCATPMTVQFNRLFGVDKIKPRIGNQNLVIAFDYLNSNLEKVTHDESPDGKFFLTVMPKAGAQPVDINQVQYSYTGADADIIFVVGARNLEDLGGLYQQEKTLLDNKEKTLVNLSSLDRNSQFGTVNLYDPTASGSSEIVYYVIRLLELPLEPDTATNLLAGIEGATQNLVQAKAAETFEAVAELMKAGGQRNHLTVNTGFNNVNPFSRPAAGQPFVQSVNPNPVAAQPDWLKPKVLSGGSQI